MEYTDITDIVQRLNSVFEEKKYFNDAYSKICCDCGKIKPNNNFINCSGVSNANRCEDCRDIVYSKLYLRTAISEFIKNDMDVNVSKKINRIKEILEKNECHSWNRNIQCKYDKILDALPFMDDKEYVELIKIKYPGCHSCESKKGKLYSIIKEFEKKQKSLINICCENITDESVKLKTILYKLNKKIKNYDASKH